MAAARRRAVPAPSRPISRKCSAAVRTGFAGCCRADTAPAPGSSSRSSPSPCCGWRAGSTGCSPTRSAWCCASAPITARPNRVSTTICRRRSRSALTPSVTRVNRTEIGYRSGEAPSTRAGSLQQPQEALMLTGDENIVDINFTRVLGDQGCAALSVQHPRPRSDGEIGGRKRDARGRRRNPDRPGARRRARQDRDRDLAPVAIDPRFLRRRYRSHPGAAGQGRSAGAGDRRVPRRPARPCRPRAAAQRGGGLP